MASKRENLSSEGNSLESGLCVRDSQDKIIFQNAKCESVCHRGVGEICEYCSNSIKMDFSGVRKLKRFNVGQYNLDAALVVTPSQKSTIFHVMDTVLTELNNQIGDSDLTAKERDVATLILEGESNSGICSKIGVGISTLKTHLNRIYQKLPDLKSFREQLS